VCCNSVPRKNLLTDENGIPFKIYEAPVEKVWNSDQYKKIRQQFISGEKPEMCERCFREEEAGVQSARQKNNERWSSDYEDKTELPMDIKYIDLRLGNLCNLKCRMCNPYASSNWVQEWNKVVSKAELVPNFLLDEKESDRLLHLDWPSDERTWENLKTIIGSVEEIYLTGGEPFLSMEQRILLRHLIEKEDPSKIVLKYNTNLTLLPDELVELWLHFKKVKVNISLDAVGDLNHYIRYPADWGIIKKNLDRIYELNNTETGIHTTVQMYNILYLDKIYEYFVNNYSTHPYLNILNHPSCLNIRVLPQELKDIAREKLRPLIEFSEVREVLSYLDKECWFKQSFEEFKNYTMELDSLRGQSLLSVVPEFSKYF
jgi:sulfatase maturation enzyme AslB (radical SAM superfamily)